MRSQWYVVASHLNSTSSPRFLTTATTYLLPQVITTLLAESHLGRELDVLAEVTGEGDHLAGDLEALGPRDAQLVLQVDVLSKVR